MDVTHKLAFGRVGRLSEEYPWKVVETRGEDVRGEPKEGDGYSSKGC